MTVSATQPLSATQELAVAGGGESPRTMLKPSAALRLVVAAVALSVLAAVGLILLRPTATPTGSPVTATVAGSAAGVPELTRSGADWLLRTGDVSCMVSVQAGESGMVTGQPGESGMVTGHPGESGLLLTPLPPVSGACASAVAALR